MKKVLKINSLSAAVALGCLLLAHSLLAQEVTPEQLLKEIQELRKTVVLQQQLIEDMQGKVEANVVSKAAIKSELTEELKQTFAGQQNKSMAALAPWLSQVEMYGHLHASVDFLDDGTYLSGNSSRIGFRGDEAIDGDLSAVWQVEMSINIDEGSSSDFNLRDTFVGLKKAPIGSLLVGRMDSAFERLHRWTDFFDDQIGDSRNIVGFGPGSHGFDNREDNSIKYISPDINGFTAMATYTTPEGEQGGSTLAANVAFRNDEGLMLAGGVEVHGADLATAGPEKELGMRLVGSYEWDHFKLAGILEYLDNVGGVDGLDRTSGGFGGAYKFDDKNTIKAQFRHTSGISDDYESTGYSFGLDHSLSERTRVYLAYAITLNESLATNGVTGGGHGETVTPSPGDNSQGISFGVVHSW
ncbi:MAG: putative porin [Lentimonas sp.]|jgi:predicted porin